MKQDDTTELIHVLFGIFHRMKEEMSFTNNLMHLSIVQIQTLIFLYHHEKCSMTEIADYFHIELPSATSSVNKLYDHKLIERYEDSRDRRLVRITLTNEGKTLVKKAMCERRKKLENMLSYLKDEEKSELLKILKTVYTRLQR